MPKQEVAKVSESLPPVEYAQTPQQIKAQVVLIQEVMRDVMTDGQHFGTIPGCGDKPTLFKAGAEKLSLTFRLRPIMDNERDIRVEELPNGHKTIHVYCHIMNQAGLELATGVGSCSTMESKFRYRDTEKTPTDKPIPPDYWKFKGDHAKQQALIGGRLSSLLSVVRNISRLVGQLQSLSRIARTFLKNFLVWMVCTVKQPTLITRRHIA